MEPRGPEHRHRPIRHHLRALCRGTPRHPEADMEPRPVGIPRPTEVGRVPVRHPAMAELVLAIEPISTAQAPVGQAIRHEGAREGPWRVGDDVIGRTHRIVISSIPVIHPLPHIARDIHQPEAVGGVAGLEREGRGRPAEIRSLEQPTRVEADRGRPWECTGGERIRGSGPVREGTIPVGVRAPGKHRVGIGQSAPGRKLPLPLRRQAIPPRLEVDTPSGQGVTGSQPFAGARPVAESRRTKPPHPRHRMGLPVVPDTEHPTRPDNTAVGVGSVSVAVNVRATRRVNKVRPNLDQALGHGGVQEPGIFEATHRPDLDVEGIQNNPVHRHFVARMRRIHKTKVVPHHEFPARNAHHATGKGVGGEVGIGQPPSHATDQKV